MDLAEILGKELAEQVEEKLGDDYVVVEEENHVSKQSFNDEREKLKSEKEALEEKNAALEEQIEQRDSQLEQLREDTQATEELQEKVQEFEEKNEQLKQEKEELVQQKEEELQSKISQEKKARALEVELAKSGAKHSNLLMKEADLEALEVEDGEVAGIDDVISDLQENYEDLFVSESIKGKGLQNGKTPGSKPNPDEMSDAEYIEARENGDL